MKVLLAEDQDIQAKHCEDAIDLLSLEKVEVIRCKTGEEVIAKARSENPDFLIVDLTLNGMRGDTAIATLRNVKILKWEDTLGTRREDTLDLEQLSLSYNGPIFVLSTSKDQGDINRAFAAGANAYFDKGIDWESEILFRIQAMLRCYNNSSVLPCLKECPQVPIYLPRSRPKQEPEREISIGNKWELLYLISKRFSPLELGLVVVIVAAIVIAIAIIV